MITNNMRVVQLKMIEARFWPKIKFETIFFQVLWQFLPRLARRRFSFDFAQDGEPVEPQVFPCLPPAGRQGGQVLRFLSVRLRSHLNMISCLVGNGRIELPTSSLSVTRSTTELVALIFTTSSYVKSSARSNPQT